MKEQKVKVRVQGFILAIAVFFLAAALPAFAHHGFEAEFTLQKPVTITGVVTKVDWINPHAYLYLDVKDKTGKTVSWAFETLNPGLLHRNGMQREMFPVGQTLTIDGFGARDASKSLAWITRIHFPDGRTIVVSNPTATSNP